MGLMLKICDGVVLHVNEQSVLSVLAYTQADAWFGDLLLPKENTSVF